MDKQIFVIVIGAMVQMAAAAGEPLPTPEELYDRVWQNAQVQSQSAQGRYLRRVFNIGKSAEQVRTETDATIQQIEAQQPERSPRERQRMSDQLPAIRSQLESQAQRTTWTSIDTYRVKGDKYRVDRSFLPDDKPLSELVSAAGQAVEGVASPYTHVWNGQFASILDRATETAGSTGSDLRVDRLVLTSDRPDIPTFLAFGRTAPDRNLVATFKSQGFPVTVEPRQTEEGEALVLKVGDERSVSLYLEAVVLPAKGYVVSDSMVKMQGAVQMREKFRRFVRTNAGFWVPMEVDTEAYRLSPQGVPQISSHLELVAIEPPQVDIPIEDKVFDLTPRRDTTVHDTRAGVNRSYVVPGTDTSFHVYTDPTRLIAAPVPVTVPTAQASQAADVVSSVRTTPTAVQIRTWETWVKLTAIAVALSAGMTIGFWLWKRRAANGARS